MFRIKNYNISVNSKIFSIAEIGINHNGSISNAINLINYAKEAGFNAVKFQTYDVDEMLKDNTKLANYQRKTNFNNMKSLLRKYSFNHQQFSKLNNYCKKKNILFLSTPFDIKSALFLNKLKVPAFKISSGDLNNFYLLSVIKRFNKPIILSSGMALKKDVEESVKFLKLSRNKLAILHCISDYPTEIKNSYLSNIKSLKSLGYTVGFSDHTIGMESSCSAVSLGAKIIEKHITLNRKMTGPDHYCSLECNKLKDFIEKIQAINYSTFNSKRKLTSEEKKTQKVAKKSLYFFKDMKKNQIIKFKDIIPLRPFNGGITPSKYKTIIGKKLKKNVKKFTLVSKKII